MTEEVLFHAVLAQPAELRGAYLDAHCADPELRRAVEELLAAHDRHVGPLESPPTGAYEPSASVGTIFAGRYKLREVLGEGGMGTVYVADQLEPVQRRVALKIIRTGLDSARLLARFEQERQALALMDHPNIAKVFDAGIAGEPGASATGVPYFAMELIKGVPITRYCDEAKLTPRQRLELFIPVCQAVQHAHQKGIIHRDLKPSNVLIGLYDGRPVPKVIDFGVAKATGPRLTDQSIYTEVGSLVGTLEYMAPEQAELNNLDIDTRADIYALGVILYELLTGSVPFSRKELQSVGFAEMLRTIKEVEPPKPSTKLSDSGSLPAIAASRGLDPRKLEQQLRGELDWIAMKCLEKERSRRYETANQLVLEIQRYLADEPVLAGPPSLGYRLHKWLRRNRGPALAASLIFASLVGGIIATSFGLVRAQNARDSEAWQRSLAEANAQKALAAAKAEKKAKEEAEAVLDFVQNKIIATARPEWQPGGLGKDVTMRRALEASLPFVANSFKDRPLIEARLRLTLGTSFWTMNEGRIGLKQYEIARSLFEKHLGRDDINTLACMGNIAISYVSLGRHADAIKLFEETLPLRKAKFGLEDRDTLLMMGNLANTYAGVGRHADAVKMLEEVLPLLKESRDAEKAQIVNFLAVLARSMMQIDRGAEAITLIDECMQRSSRLVVDPRTIPTLMDLRLRHFEKVQDAQGCRQTADMWEALNRTDAESLYLAFIMRFVAANATSRSTEPDAARLTEAQAGQAMTWLRKAVAAKPVYVKELLAETDFTVLRDQADFIELLWELADARR